ncbi:hypothetical protein ANO14919_062740 [Xylariales sp. No.14919]|nr:hypothetical protein ANO14919_062740 [Xylariales sp. No.14919]
MEWRRRYTPTNILPSRMNLCTPHILACTPSYPESFSGVKMANYLIAKKATIAAFHAGNRVPELRQFVAISSDGPVDSPEKLQRLADLPSISEVIETNEAHGFPDSISDAIQVCRILWEAFKRLRDYTDLKQILVWMPYWRTKEPEMRAAYIITSVKEKNAISGDVGEK